MILFETLKIRDGLENVRPTEIPKLNKSTIRWANKTAIEDYILTPKNHILSAAYGTSFKRDHIIGHKSSLNKYGKTEVTVGNTQALEDQKHTMSESLKKPRRN